MAISDFIRSLDLFSTPINGINNKKDEYRNKWGYFIVFLIILLTIGFGYFMLVEPIQRERITNTETEE